MDRNNRAEIANDCVPQNLSFSNPIESSLDLIELLLHWGLSLHLLQVWEMLSNEKSHDIQPAANYDIVEVHCFDAKKTFLLV